MTLTKRTENLRINPVEAWTEEAMSEAGDRLLRQIYYAPLDKRFCGKAGITITFCRYRYRHGWDFDRVYHIAKALQDRGLVLIESLGTATFSVTTTKDQETRYEHESS